MDNLQSKINIVKEQLNEHTGYSYLLKHIQRPVIDEIKILLLLNMLNDESLTDEQVEKYTLTTMLVQIALDTHENVSNDAYSETETHLLKERQLTVLGGIYYSSLYYKILANMGDINLTRALSLAIKQINEKKIIIYKEDAETIEELFENLKIVETALFTNIGIHFNITNWRELAENVFYLKRLTVEKNNLIKGTSTPFVNNLIKLVYHNDNKTLEQLTDDHILAVLAKCNQFGNDAIAVIRQSLERIPHLNDFVLNTIETVIDQYNYNGKITVGEW